MLSPQACLAASPVMPVARGSALCPVQIVRQGSRGKRAGGYPPGAVDMSRMVEASAAAARIADEGAWTTREYRIASPW
jgi:hypothetical protein